ncbi:MAG: 16S rRNA (guanine(527)-N(7))-methyltransferase RsmG [Xanthomonadales bacterium]|nr:16S rRNA (guanine(527)-N(7))-methyltransferase RsmG [Xanthomonadales bacterium]
MNLDHLEPLLRAGIDSLGLALGDDIVRRLLDYQALLARWNHTYNLTAVRDPQQMVVRHLLDSLAVLPYVRGPRLADLGTGAGLPGMPLAIAMPGIQVSLVDANGKKVRFLREAIRTLKLDNVKAVQDRMENLGGEFDCITSRALSSVGDMLGAAGHLLATDGIWLALKGQRPEAELAALPPGFAVRAVHALSIPGLGAERHLLVLARAPH